MTAVGFWKLVFRSLLHYWRTHIGVVLGTAVCSMILTGALLVGDSVRHSLQRIVEDRLGKISFALASDERFFRSRLAGELAKSLLGNQDLTGETSEPVLAVPALQLRGMAIKDGGELRVNGVTVMGVDEGFWRLGAQSADIGVPGLDEAFVNERLADRLNLSVGDELLLRVEKAYLMPQEAPLALGAASTVSLRLTVRSIASDRNLGRFSLRANQIAPFNIFVSKHQLAEKMELSGLANLLLVAGTAGRGINVDTLQSTLREIWTLRDVGLEVRELGGGDMVELRSDRVFLDPIVEEAAFSSLPEATGILTYFVNEIRSQRGLTPYSFVSSYRMSSVPSDLAEDEIVINTWLAEDLQVDEGDQVSMAYYVLGPDNRLIEETRSFRIRSVVPLVEDEKVRELMPLFPGLHDAESCRSWDTGIPIDLDRIRDKDEVYWFDHRGTPKAFVPLSSARRMWSNRYGSLTAIRYSARGEPPDAIAERIRQDLDPIAFGLEFQAVREQGLSSGREGVDFSGLFIGLSFFIIAAALLLTALLFSFAAENRSEETGLLLAVGFRARRILLFFLAEGAVLALAGSLSGSFLGILYNRAVLYGLSTVWRGAVQTSQLSGSIKAPTLLMGIFTATLAALAAMMMAIRRQVTRPVARLQAAPSSHEGAAKPSKPWVSLGVATGSIAGILILFSVFGVWSGQRATEAFFGGGALLLIASLSLGNMLLMRFGRAQSRVVASIGELGIRNSTRRRRRSLTIVGLIACGIFIVTAVGANRRDLLAGAAKRDSGTGGYSLYAETTLPVLKDLNSQEGREHFGLEEIDSGSTEFFQIRQLEGDDASCLNLNRVQRPRILGVDPDILSSRGSFSLVQILEGFDRDKGWRILNESIDENTVPAIADQSVITWGLGKSLGDTLLYRDERGRELRLQLVGGLANSIFQGSLIISESVLRERFPTTSRNSLFLVDGPESMIPETAALLEERLQDYGVELIPTAERLARFNQVENTYLSIFLALGGMGLLIGSVGLAIVVLRNVLERRSELALLQAVGFARRSIRWLMLSEHGILLAAGALFGMVSAFLAVLPSLLSSGVEIPWAFLLGVVGAIILSSFLWIILATHIALRGDLIPALRND